MAEMRRSRVMMVCLDGALICQMQRMPFVDSIDFVVMLVFLSDFVLIRNSVTRTRSVTMMNSVTAALPIIETDFVK